MDRSNVVAEMLRLVPEVKPSYDELIKWYRGEDPGLHVVFGDVLAPHLLELLGSDGKQQGALTRVFALLEEMATSDDECVQEVLVVSVLERLGDPPILARARRYMRAATRESSDKLEEGWRRFLEADAGPARRDGG